MGLFGNAGGFPDLAEQMRFHPFCKPKMASFLKGIENIGDCRDHPSPFGQDENGR